MIRRNIISRRGGVTVLSTVVAVVLMGATGAGGAIEFPGPINNIDQGNVGHHHIGSGNQGQHNTGSGNSGFSNSGSGNSGLFNSGSENLGFAW